MFEIGEKYILTVIESDGAQVEKYNCIVVDYDKKNAILKIDQFGKEYIYNISSHSFVSATKQ